MGNFDYYVHIMLIGVSIDHVKSACDDLEFSPIKRIYLIHSPNQKKSDGPNPMALEKIAKDTKKWIEKSKPRTKVILRKLTKDGAFDNLETITEIKKIVSEEKKRSDHISTKQIAINVTGGTNMMAGGATLAAFYEKTEAYYVKDTRFITDEKEFESSLISKIGISELQDNTPLLNKEKNILYTIKNSTFDWPTPKPGIRNDPVKGYAIKYRTDAIQDTKWITEQHLSGTIKQKDLQAVFPKITSSTFHRDLKGLEKRGMIRIEKGIPTLTSEKRQTRYHYRDYVINEKEKLIEIIERGLSEIHTYTP